MLQQRNGRYMVKHEALLLQPFEMQGTYPLFGDQAGTTEIS